jgi:ADP-L-glycero-D-manno-heptose 6-epimerase
MRILVTGGSGFVGSALVRRLTGHEVIITGRNNEQHTNSPCISYTFHDLDWKTISPIDIVFHQAAITDTTYKPDEDFYFVNVLCAQALFNDALFHGCKKFVYASSCAVYGASEKPFKETDATPSTPINAYGSSKILFDEWAMPWGREHNVNVVGLRYSNVYGEGEGHKGKSSSMIYQLMQQMKSGRPRLFKWGEQQRDFVHIDDIIDANLLAAEVKESGVFNVGSGNPTSFNKIVAILNEVLGTNHEPEYFDNPIATSYQNYTSCDLTKSTQILGYTPKANLKEGIERYVKSSS